MCATIQTRALSFFEESYDTPHHANWVLVSPGGGPTQRGGDQRSGGGGDGAAACTKMSHKRCRRLLWFRGRIGTGTGAGGGDCALNLNLNLPHQLTCPPLPGDRGKKKRPRGARGRKKAAEIKNSWRGRAVTSIEDLSTLPQHSGC